MAAASAAAAPSSSSECPVCTMAYSADTRHANAPRFLHCGHSLCTDCAGKIFAQGAVLCPVCREATRVTAASQLKINFTLVELIAAHEKAPKASAAPRCSECERQVSELFCENCDAPLCRTCFDAAHTTKVQRLHRAVPVAERDKAKQMVCKDHAEPLKLYCVADSTFLCTICQVSGPHRGHNIRFVGDAAKEARASLEGKEQALHTEMEDMRAVVRNINATTEALEAAAVKATADVNTHFVALMRKLQARQTRLTRDITAAKDRKAAALAQQRDEVAASIAKKEATLAELSKARAGTDAEVLVALAGTEGDAPKGPISMADGPFAAPYQQHAHPVYPSHQSPQRQQLVETAHLSVVLTDGAIKQLDSLMEHLGEVTVSDPRQQVQPRPCYVPAAWPASGGFGGSAPRRS